ncbi:MAG: hypothetical protein AABY22_02995 [Nanoarchaeota archaeon]
MKIDKVINPKSFLGSIRAKTIFNESWICLDCAIKILGLKEFWRY